IDMNVLHTGEPGDDSIEKFYLYQNYPNPFNPETTIKFQIAKPGFVQLKIYDLLGNEVANLVDGYKTSGVYSINFMAQDLPSGIYFYKLDSNQYSETKKLVILK
ncbi:MAG: T9SS type A sorting domain-containing protein, partial [Ignavibacteriaceae bacterium]|nr:T9SS type A sorting domain-containing protein [Ignavibacteriaceae bacterium]